VFSINIFRLRKMPEGLGAQRLPGVWRTRHAPLVEGIGKQSLPEPLSGTPTILTQPA
jgi:hypothetical protein